MILLSSCRDMAILAREKTRGLLLTMFSWRNNYNLLQNDNDKFLVPKQSFGLEMSSNAFDNKNMKRELFGTNLMACGLL